MEAGLREQVIRFLDDLRAAEAASAEVLRAWVAVCAADELRGGLRAIAVREAAHAGLLAERLGELGAPCVASVAETVRVAALARFGSATVSDDEKLAGLLGRYPSDAAVTEPITRLIDQLDGDLETRELLRLVAEGEVATFAWLRAYRG